MAELVVATLTSCECCSLTSDGVRQDFVGGPGPCAAAVFVPGVDEPGDRGLKLAHGAEDTATDRLAGDDADKTSTMFIHDPRSTGEMQWDGAVLNQPHLDVSVATLNGRLSPDHLSPRSRCSQCVVDHWPAQMARRVARQGAGSIMTAATYELVQLCGSGTGSVNLLGRYRVVLEPTVCGAGRGVGRAGSWRSGGRRICEGSSG